MRNFLLTLALALSVGAAANAAPTKSQTGNHLRGDYVEARTASVFAGACHFGGEVTTTGREAEMVWHVRDGAWNGVSLEGLNAMAAVVGSENLRDEEAARRSVLYIDVKATPAQAEALTAALQANYGKSLGKLVAVKRVPITFARQDESYRVEAKGVGNLVVDAMPNHECCKLPNMVWYTPLIELSNRRVGYTRTSSVLDKTLGANWTKSGQNTAFYGEFSL
ncbi:MAG TPA: DUF1326 domain-containing protein [Chthonomonadaceae bacterium]|nr:DUF1326 domain-containing protein [Chthonomonadaceae bacterium]